jgi:hypothetical protein
MDRLPFEQLLLLLLFIVLPLLNWLLQRARRRVQSELPEYESVPQMGQQMPRRPPPPDEPLRERPRADSAPATPVPPRRRSGPRALLRTPGDRRRAIIIMTVMGPCRAYDRPN